MPLRELTERGPLRILHVEDDVVNAELFSAILEPEGHTIVLETTGPAGRARAMAELFDLIALDIQLPGLSGDSLCAELKKAGLQTPILAITASAMPEEMDRVRAAGFDELLTKPVDPGELRTAVLRLGEIRSSPASPIASSALPLGSTALTQ